MVDMGLTRVGTRAQVDENIMGVGIARVGIPVFNMFSSSLNQLNTTSTRLDLCFSCANQETIRFTELVLHLTASLFIKEHRDFFHEVLE